jgi:hypothetical protein
MLLKLTTPLSGFDQHGDSRLREEIDILTGFADNSLLKAVPFTPVSGIIVRFELRLSLKAPTWMSIGRLNTLQTPQL